MRIRLLKPWKNMLPGWTPKVSEPLGLRLIADGTAEVAPEGTRGRKTTIYQPIQTACIPEAAEEPPERVVKDMTRRENSGSDDINLQGKGRKKKAE